MTIALACASPYDPFQIPEEELRRRVDTVAVVGLEANPDLVDVERLRASLEPLVITRLREGGFQVVPPEEWERRWLAVAHDMGGIWDPATGVADDERYVSARAAIYRELAAEHGMDAILKLDITQDAIEASGPTPPLCGAMRDVYWPGGIDLSLGERVTHARGVCLEVRMYDLDHELIYGIRSGLEYIDTYAHQTHASKPFAERVTDRELIDRSLDVVLGPIVAREQP